MCGRFDQAFIKKEFEVRYGSELEEDFNPIHNIGVGQYAHIILNSNANRVIKAVFGYSPRWAEKPMYFFNARSEGKLNEENAVDYDGELGIFKMPSFRDAIIKQRCIVPVTGFYEGPAKEKLKRPFHITSDGERIFSLAGLWGEYVNKETGEVINTFSIVTTPALPLMQKIGHHRSPLFLHKDYEEDWLNNEADKEDVQSIIKTRYYPEDLAGIEINPAQLKTTSTYINKFEVVGQPL